MTVSIFVCLCSGVAAYWTTTKTAQVTDKPNQHKKNPKEKQKQNVTIKIILISRSEGMQGRRIDVIALHKLQPIVWILNNSNNNNNNNHSFIR
jgi:hypothetical protein